jgi:hypothetical protein
METIGFIILRHVNSSIANKYWIQCYDCIRNHYPENTIMIIDDNSDYNFITNKELYKTHIIQSEYPKRGELLPYYYYLHNKLFDKAVFIHDSVFINKYIDFSYIDKYKMIWDFEQHDWDQPEDEYRMISVFNDTNLIEFHKSQLWNGCYGCMIVITHDHLTNINNKYDISKLLDLILNRYNRCSFERVIACILQNDDISADISSSIFGDIHEYRNKYEFFIESIEDIPLYLNTQFTENLPLIKMRLGR